MDIESNLLCLFSILINGVPSLPFSPYRAICQGDPLSPFLFIIMEEGLSRFIQASIENLFLDDLPLHDIDPLVTHSHFVDDTLMMGSPMIQEAHKFLHILKTFYDASGMDLNKDKYQIFFFNTPILV